MRSNLIRAAIFLSAAAFSFQPLDTPKENPVGTFLLIVVGTAVGGVFMVFMATLVDAPGKWRWPSAETNPLSLRRRPLELLLAFALMTWGLAVGASGYLLVLGTTGGLASAGIFAAPAVGSWLALRVVRQLWRAKISRDAPFHD